MYKNHSTAPNLAPEGTMMLILKLFREMLHAQTEEDAQRKWRMILHLLSLAAFSPQDRATLCDQCRELVRRELIHFCFKQYKACPQNFPEVLPEYLRLSQRLRINGFSASRRAKYDGMDAAHSTLLNTLEACTTIEQVNNTASVLMGAFDTLGEYKRRLCYSALLQRTEDCILASLLQAVPRLSLTRRHHFMLSLLACLDGSPHGEYALNFIYLENAIFYPVDFQTISKASDEATAKQYIKTFFHAVPLTPPAYAALCTRKVADIILPLIKQADVVFDEETQFCVECLQTIDSGTFFVGVDDNSNHDMGVVTDALSLLHDLNHPGSALERREIWEAFCNAAHEVPYLIHMLADRAFHILSLQVLSAINSAYKNELPAKLALLIRLYLGLSIDPAHVYDETVQAWILGESNII